MTTEEQRQRWKEAHLRWKLKDPEHARRLAREGAARRRKADPDKYRAKDRKFAKSNPIRIRGYGLKRNYGITLQDWEALFDKQGRRCAICATDNPGKRRWATDHDHDTGHVRGILCHGCNLLLGRLGDTAEKAAFVYGRIARYLECKAA